MVEEGYAATVVAAALVISRSSVRRLRNHVLLQFESPYHR
jgi:hypothetical protein